MPKFMVTADSAPAVVRAGVGVFKVDDVLALPDAASVKGEKVSLKLRPMEPAAFDLLMQQHGKEKVKEALGADTWAEYQGIAEKAADKGEPDGKPMSVKDAAKKHGKGE